MLVKLATECDSEIASSTGDRTGGVEGLATVIGAPSLADLHVLEAGLHTGVDRVSAIHLTLETHTRSGSSSEGDCHVLGTVRIIHKVTHGHKGVTQSFRGSDSLVCVQAEHPLQQVNELSSVSFLSQHVRSLQM